MPKRNWHLISQVVNITLCTYAYAMSMLAKVDLCIFLHALMIKNYLPYS